MKPSEANKIIAEFMGVNHKIDYKGDVVIDGTIPKNVGYSMSLDALVPVWEKLNMRIIQPRFMLGVNDLKGCGIKHGAICSSDWEDEILGFETTFQQAAAIATAKAIKELRK